MTIVQAVLLGAIQGLAEFLPISSSGHLAIASRFIAEQQSPLLFDILLHVATLASVCLVFRRRIAELFMVAVRWIIRKPRETDSSDQSMLLALIAGTAVTGVAGLLLKDLVSDFSPFLISCCFVITGIFLFVSGRHVSVRTTAVPGVVQGLVIGLAQGIGVIPGISRSGSTISASLFAGLDRKTAGEFSFLLSIPAILAAFILELKSADTLGSHVPVAALVAGMLTAFVVGYLSLKFLLGLIQRGKLGWFAVYLIPAGIALAVYFFPG